MEPRRRSRGASPKTLQSRGCQAEALPAGAVRDVAGYHPVVLGSAVYMARWRREARRFARRHGRELRAMPVWLFSSGPLDSPAEKPKAFTAPPGAKRLARRLGAREHVVFGGRLPLQPRNRMERPMVRNTPPERRDARDWEAIEAWAQRIAAEVMVPVAGAAPEV
jgi:menaquinone-dependent protoporphyrinogen oxidase